VQLAQPTAVQSSAACRGAADTGDFMSLADLAVRLMSGDFQAAQQFVESMSEEVRLDFDARLAPLRDQAYGRMLRDTAAFMAFKVPELVVPLPLPKFKSAVDASLSGDLDALGHVLDGLDLQGTYVLFSSCMRLIDAWKTRPLRSQQPKPLARLDSLSQKPLF